jgi:hypothetical protein
MFQIPRLPASGFRLRTSVFGLNSQISKAPACWHSAKKPPKALNPRRKSLLCKLKGLSNKKGINKFVKQGKFLGKVVSLYRFLFVEPH